jgi:hypothetical protein
MKKRALAALLWFYAMWYVGAMVASVLSLSPALGPILGVAAAAVIAGDPRRIIWTRPTLNGATSAATSAMQNPA